MGEENNQTSHQSEQKAKFTPLQLLIIMGLLEGALEVDALAIDKGKSMEIVLKGSLKGQPELEKFMAGVSKVSFKK